MNFLLYLRKTQKNLLPDMFLYFFLIHISLIELMIIGFIFPFAKLEVSHFPIVRISKLLQVKLGRTEKTTSKYFNEVARPPEMIISISNMIDLIRPFHMYHVSM